MTEANPDSPRPVSLATIIAIFVGFALFLGLVYFTYLRHRAQEGWTYAAEKLPADQEWQATPEARKAYLLELRAKQQKQATTYAWVDQKAGTVQLPIDRAMELVVRQYASRK